MEIPKPTEADRSRFRRLVPDEPDVEVKPMFGNLGAFVNGNMFVGPFGADIGVKLPAADGARLLTQPGAGSFGPAERPMSGYISLPATWTPRQTTAWTQLAVTTARGLPLKKPKKRTGP